MDNIEKLFIEIYSLGYWDRDAKLAPFNGVNKTPEECLVYIRSYLNSLNQPCEIEQIDSVS